MTDLKKILEDYGADYETTLARFMGNEQLYLRILRKFPQDDTLQKLGQALRDGDCTNAFNAAHTLKGVTGNLGLTPLYRAVCSIVEPLRAGEAHENHAALYRSIQAEYQKVLDLLALLAEE